MVKLVVACCVVQVGLSGILMLKTIINIVFCAGTDVVYMAGAYLVIAYIGWYLKHNEYKYTVQLINAMEFTTSVVFNGLGFWTSVIGALQLLRHTVFKNLIADMPNVMSEMIKTNVIVMIRGNAAPLTANAINAIRWTEIVNRINGWMQEDTTTDMRTVVDAAYKRFVQYERDIYGPCRAYFVECMYTIDRVLLGVACVVLAMCYCFLMDSPTKIIIIILQMVYFGVIKRNSLVRSSSEKLFGTIDGYILTIRRAVIALTIVDFGARHADFVVERVSNAYNYLRSFVSN
jgi:hypothetical protein